MSVAGAALASVLAHAQLIAPPMSLPQNVDELVFLPTVVGHFPSSLLAEQKAHSVYETLIERCEFSTRGSSKVSIYDGVSDFADESPTPVTSLVRDVQTCRFRHANGAVTIIHRVGPFDVPVGHSAELDFAPETPDEHAFITENLQSVRTVSGDHYTYPPLHPHHIMVSPRPSASSATTDPALVFAPRFREWYRNQVFVAGSPFVTPQSMCDDHHPACMYFVFPPGLGIEKPKDVTFASMSRLDNIGPSALRNLTLELGWTWRGGAAAAQGLIKPIINCWFAADKTMGHGYSVLRGMGETMVWRTCVAPRCASRRLRADLGPISRDFRRITLTRAARAFGRCHNLAKSGRRSAPTTGRSDDAVRTTLRYRMPSGGYFHPGGTVHIHSRLRSQVWVLDVDAESVLPDALTRGGDAQSRSVALPYEYDYNGSLTRESQLPAELAARGLSIRAVQQHILAHHSSTVKCAYGGRQITEEVDGVTVAADHGIHAAVGNWCEEFQWRFEAGQAIAILGFNDACDEDILMHSHWHPYATFDDPVYVHGTPGFTW